LNERKSVLRQLVARSEFGEIPRGEIKGLDCSVATQLRCGGMFNNYFIANLLVSLPVKNFENG